MQDDGSGIESRFQAIRHLCSGGWKQILQTLSLNFNSYTVLVSDKAPNYSWYNQMGKFLGAKESPKPYHNRQKQFCGIPFGTDKKVLVRLRKKMLSDFPE